MNTKAEMDEVAKHEARMEEIEQERQHTTEDMLESLVGTSYKKGGTVVNNFFNYIKPPPGPIPWYCHKGHGTMRMEQFPHDRRKVLEYWECKSEGCKRCISIDRRNKTFLEILEDVKDIYDLKVLQYNPTKNTWKFESAIWIDDRLGGKVKPISTAERNQIIKHFQELLEKELEIEINSFKDYFLS